MPRAVAVLPRGPAVPEAERAHARGGGAARAQQQRARDDGRGEEGQEAQLPVPLLGRHCHCGCAALWSEELAGPCGDGHGRIRRGRAARRAFLYNTSKESDGFYAFLSWRLSFFCGLALAGRTISG